jgi:hypothetical protein
MIRSSATPSIAALWRRCLPVNMVLVEPIQSIAILSTLTVPSFWRFRIRSGFPSDLLQVANALDFIRHCCVFRADISLIGIGTVTVQYDHTVTTLRFTVPYRIASPWRQYGFGFGTDCFETRWGAARLTSRWNIAVERDLTR